MMNFSLTLGWFSNLSFCCKRSDQPWWDKILSLNSSRSSHLVTCQSVLRRILPTKTTINTCTCPNHQTIPPTIWKPNWRRKSKSMKLSVTSLKGFHSAIIVNSNSIHNKSSDWKKSNGKTCTSTLKKNSKERAIWKVICHRNYKELCGCERHLCSRILMMRLHLRSYFLASLFSL
jgi:hypothetical protein